MHSKVIFEVRYQLSECLIVSIQTGPTPTTKLQRTYSACSTVHIPNQRPTCFLISNGLPCSDKRNGACACSGACWHAWWCKNASWVSIRFIFLAHVMFNFYHVDSFHHKPSNLLLMSVEQVLSSSPRKGLAFHLFPDPTQEVLLSLQPPSPSPPSSPRMLVPSVRDFDFRR
jgi:hypothetical protein